MRQLIVRIIQLHWEPTELLWRWNPGPLPKSPVQRAAEEAWFDWQLCLLILDFEKNSQGGWYPWIRAQFDEADGTLRENFTSWSSQVPLPDPLRHDKRWSGSHFYRDSFPPGCIWRWQLQSCSLGGGGWVSFLTTNFQTATIGMCFRGKGRSKTSGDQTQPTATVWIVS